MGIYNALATHLCLTQYLGGLRGASERRHRREIGADSKPKAVYATPRPIVFDVNNTSLHLFASSFCFFLFNFSTHHYPIAALKNQTKTFLKWHRANLGPWLSRIILVRLPTTLQTNQIGVPVISTALATEITILVYRELQATQTILHLFPKLSMPNWSWREKKPRANWSISESWSNTSP